MTPKNVINDSINVLCMHNVAILSHGRSSSPLHLPSTKTKEKKRIKQGGAVHDCIDPAIKAFKRAQQPSKYKVTK